MDDILSSFQGAFSVATNPLDPSGPYPRLTQYKFKREGFADQEARRKKALQEQCLKRKNFADLSRRIVEGDLLSDDEMEEGGYDEIDTNSSSAQRVKAPYRNQLMLSEWLVDIPYDLYKNWLVVICPIAKRCLVVSAKGLTTAYSRSGHRMHSFPSLLPGGAKRSIPRSTDYCILDCFFDSIKSTFYILDVMCWTGRPIYDSDTEFRCYWLHTKLSEYDHDLTIQASINPYKFIPLQYHTCSKLSEIVSSSWPVAVDGLLFFHTRSHYCLGRTPLALWLKPHMVSDVLGLPVSQQFLDCAPVLSDAVTKMETERRSETRPRQLQTKKMEIEEGDDKRRET